MGFLAPTLLSCHSALLSLSCCHLGLLDVSQRIFIPASRPLHLLSPLSEHLCHNIFAGLSSTVTFYEGPSLVSYLMLPPRSCPSYCLLKMVLNTLCMILTEHQLTGGPCLPGPLVNT